jgi:hypothetical protein
VVLVRSSRNQQSTQENPSSRVESSSPGSDSNGFFGSRSFPHTLQVTFCSSQSISPAISPISYRQRHQETAELFSDAPVFRLQEQSERSVDQFIAAENAARNNPAKSPGHLNLDIDPTLAETGANGISGGAIAPPGIQSWEDASAPEGGSPYRPELSCWNALRNTAILLHFAGRSNRFSGQGLSMSKEPADQSPLLSIN